MKKRRGGYTYSQDLWKIRTLSQPSSLSCRLLPDQWHCRKCEEILGKHGEVWLDNTIGKRLNMHMMHMIKLGTSHKTCWRNDFEVWSYGWQGCIGRTMRGSW